MVILSRKRLLKPSKRVDIDWTHPLARGLKVFHLAWEGAGNNLEDMTGNGHTFTGTEPWVATADGAAKGSLTGATHLDNTTYSLTNEFTFAIRARLTALSTDQPGKIFGKQEQYNTTGAALYQGWVAASDVFFSVNNVRAISPTGVLAAGNTYTIVGTYDGATIRIYLDGTERANTAHTLGPGATTYSLRVAQNGAINPHVIWDGIWDRALTAEEVKEQHFNQYGILRSTKRRIYAAPAAGGPTLISASDSISISLSESVAILSILTPSDSVTLSASDVAAVMAIFSASDTATVSLTETAQLAVIVSALDTISVGVTDAASVLGILAVADSLSLSLAETVTILSTLAVSDSASLTLSDIAAVMAIVSASDVTTLSVTDAASIVVAFSAVDSVSLSVSESVNILSLLQVSDVLSLTVGEVVSIFSALSVTDTVTISVSDIAALAALIQASDSLSLTLGDVAAVTTSSDAIKNIVEAIAKFASVVTSDAKFGKTQDITTKF